MRREYWLPPSTTASTAESAHAKAAKPLSGLTRLQPDKRPGPECAVAATGRLPSQLGHPPIPARSTDWSALADLRGGEIIGYANIDGF